MMQTTCVFATVLLACSLAWALGDRPASHSGRGAIAELFPPLEGWESEGEPAVYGAGDLWEYINGAAELYITYDFEELGTLGYSDGGDGELTVEIYRHASPADAYGIYSRERPTPMDAVEVGAQAYYSPGTLNFCQGHYYVKLSGYGLGEGDRDALAAAARAVSDRIGGGTDLPAALRCFPEEGIVAGTERYVARNLFGHRFLHSAFVAEYRTNDDATALAFIIEVGDSAEAARVLDEYLGLVRNRDGRISEGDGAYRFEDPVSRSAGTIHLKQVGRYVWGLSAASTASADAFIAGVEKKLEAASLLD